MKTKQYINTNVIDLLYYVCLNGNGEVSVLNLETNTYTRIFQIQSTSMYMYHSGMENPHIRKHFSKKGNIHLEYQKLGQNLLQVNLNILKQNFRNCNVFTVSVVELNFINKRSKMNKSA